MRDGMKGKRDHPDAGEASSSGEEQGVPLGQDEADKQSETFIALHRARMLDWSPSAVTALAATADGTVLAAARESGNIELWTTDHWSLAEVSSHRPAYIYWVEQPYANELWHMLSLLRLITSLWHALCMPFFCHVPGILHVSCHSCQGQLNSLRDLHSEAEIVLPTLPTHQASAERLNLSYWMHLATQLLHTFPPTPSPNTHTSCGLTSSMPTQISSS